MKTTLGSQLWLHTWDDDAVMAAQIDDMLSCGLRIARVFIPWEQVEPENGRWDFGLFDRFFALCEDRGMLIAPTLTCVMGTPRWHAAGLGGRIPTQADDEELDALRMRHASVVASRYGKSHALCCWILANEPKLSLPVNDATIRGFRRYLARCHTDTAAFARLYGRPSPDEVGECAADGTLSLDMSSRWNYAVKVDWAGYEADTLMRRLEIVGRAVKAADPNHPTTVNPDGITTASPFSGGRDLWRFGRGVDVLGLSCHVSWHSVRFAPGRIHQSVGMFCDMVRSATRASDRAFHVTELQAGTNYFSGSRPMCPSPSDIEHWLWESAFAGATGIIYWLFNARDQGFEGLEWGLNRQDGSPSDRTAATRAVFDGLSALGERACAAPPDVYLLHDVDAMVLGEIEGGAAEDGAPGKHNPRTPLLVGDALCGAYCMLRDMGYAVGFTDPEGISALPRDATLIAANTYAMRLSSVRAVDDFARHGGRVIADGLFAAKDEYGNMHMAARPVLTRLFGGIVEDFGVEQNALAMRADIGDIPAFYLRAACDELPGRQVLARWDDGKAAAIGFNNNVYIGTQFFQGYFVREGTDAIARAFLAPHLPPRHGAYLRNPSGELGLRVSGELIAVMNRGSACDADIAMPPGMSLADAFTGAEAPLPLTMEQDKIRILRMRLGGNT